MPRLSPRPGLLLGQQVGSPEQYAPELLFPIPRADGRAALGIGDTLPFHGSDIWHCYEVSWLKPDGRPAIAMATLEIPAESEFLVESKSLKLYLNSHNSTPHATAEAFTHCVQRDLGAVLGVVPQLSLHAVDAAALAGQPLPGECIDAAPLASLPQAPDARQLRLEPHTGEREEVLHSHLLRSLCPVTAQPDWASVVIDYQGRALDRSALLAYLLAFRMHQEFHEQCVERIYTDIKKVAAPTRLSVHALYTRRGGLDICPWRSSEAGAAPRYRMVRQ